GNTVARPNTAIVPRDQSPSGDQNGKFHGFSAAKSDLIGKLASVTRFWATGLRQHLLPPEPTCDEVAKAVIHLHPVNRILPSTCRHGKILRAPAAAPSARLRSALCSLCLTVVVLASGHAAQAAHAIAMHGAPAMPDGFTAAPYADPGAPRGGRMTEGVL